MGQPWYSSLDSPGPAELLTARASNSLAPLACPGALFYAEKMLTVPHMLAGAAIGALVPNSQIALPLAFGIAWGSHYVLDSVPHWERFFGSRQHGFSTATRLKEWPKFILYQAVGDVVIAVGLIGWALAARGELGHFWTSAVFWGAIGGFFPDLLDNTPIINSFLTNRFGFRNERKFHQTIHISAEAQQRLPHWLGVASQLLVIVGGAWILF